MFVYLIAFTTTMFLGQGRKWKKEYNKRVLLNSLLINNKGVSNIFRAYIEDFVYESDSVDELIKEVTEDYHNLGGFDVYEVKDAGTPQEEENFYASITF